jgi:hypothetical protein
MLLPVTALSALGHIGVLSSIERCPQQQPYLPMDILVSFPLLNVAPNNSPICYWTFMSSPPLLKLLPATALSALGHFGVLPSLLPSQEDTCVS